MVLSFPFGAIAPTRQNIPFIVPYFPPVFNPFREKFSYLFRINGTTQKSSPPEGGEDWFLETILLADSVPSSTVDLFGRGCATCAERDDSRFSVYGVNGSNAGIIILEATAVNRVPCQPFFLNFYIFFACTWQY